MRLKAHAFDREALAARPLPYERLDQLVVDLLLGVRLARERPLAETAPAQRLPVRDAGPYVRAHALRARRTAGISSR